MSARRTGSPEERASARLSPTPHGASNEQALIPGGARDAPPRAGANVGGPADSGAARSSEAANVADARALRLLGEGLGARTQDVVSQMLSGSEGCEESLDAVVEEGFARVGAVSTRALARWMSGDGPEAARDIGQESWRIFGQLAAQRSAPLNEVTKRCLCWRDAADRVLREIAMRLDLADDALALALGMLQRSLEETIVRMAESFESERDVAARELARREHELAFLATHDALTGLPNRALILDRVEQALARARRSPEPLAMLFIDLDNFKAVNETLGHSAGDELLVQVATRLAALLGEDDVLGRLGGDEFALVACGESLIHGAQHVADRVLQALGQPLEPREASRGRLTVTASVGVASADERPAEELLRDAGIAMYRAKRAGRNRSVTFEDGMQELVRSQMELRMSLRDALANEEFFLVYQPTFDLRSLTPTGMEALIRWRHPVHGVVQPEQFVPLLEDSGMIVEVGAWVLRTACRQGAEWRSGGYEIGMAVNLSTRQLETDDFIGELQDALSESGLEPGALTLELTETAVMTDAEASIARLTEIRRTGVRIAIDDFGAGYSSLGYLQRLPVDVLKIDRSFISRLTSDPDGEKLIRTLVQLGRSLSIETLAEGIEQSSELSLLKDEQCVSGQGFLFARPLDAATSSGVPAGMARRGAAQDRARGDGPAMDGAPGGVGSPGAGHRHELALGVDPPASRDG